MRRVLELFILAAAFLFIGSAMGDIQGGQFFFLQGIFTAYIAEGLVIYKGCVYIIKTYKSMLK